MKTVMAVTTIVLVFGLALPSDAQAQCASDVDCGGARLCQGGRCVAQAGCTRDTDCPGDMVCQAGVCVSPSTTAPPVPETAPPPVPTTAPPPMAPSAPPPGPGYAPAVGAPAGYGQPAAPQAEPGGVFLKTTAGTMTLGGSVFLSVHHLSPDEGEGKTGGEVSFSPYFGGFATNGLLLAGSVGFRMKFGDLYDNDYSKTKYVDFGLRFEYLFNFSPGRVVPFVGVDVLMSFSIPEEGDTVKELTVGPAGGIYIALSNHTAMKLGASVYVTRDFTNEYTFISTPTGFIGILAVF